MRRLLLFGAAIAALASCSDARPAEPDVVIDLQEASERRPFIDSTIASEFLLLTDFNLADRFLQDVTDGDATFVFPDRYALADGGWQVSVESAYFPDDTRCNELVGSAGCAKIDWSASYRTVEFSGTAEIIDFAGQRLLTERSMCELVVAAGGACI